MPKNSDYTVEEITFGSCYAVNFQLAEDMDFSPFALSIKNKIKISDCFKSALSVWERKKAGYEMKCRSYLYDIIYVIQSEYSDYFNTKQLDILKPALKYIDDNYLTDNDFSLKYLSDICGISETYLRKLFNICFKVSPIRYINNLKMTRAAELLSSGYYSVNEVVFMSGFNDISYFSRSFKKHYGVSPTEYKKINYR